MSWRRTGRSLAKLGRVLDVNPNTLTRWIRETQAAPVRVRGIELQAEPRREAGALVFVLASGHRIEGLKVEDAIKVAAALS